MTKKTHRLFSLLFVIYFALGFLLISCDKKNSSQGVYSSYSAKYKDTTGPINVITVVSDSTVYNSIYDFLNLPDVLGEELPATLMPQAYFGFRNFSPQIFDGKKETRAVLYLKKGDPEFISEPSKYAQDQAYMEVYGNNLDEVKSVIQKNRKEILQQVDYANFTFLLSRMDNDHKKQLDRIGVYMKIPAEYKLVQEQDDYQWYRLDKVDNLTAKVSGTDSKIGTQNIENFNVQVVKGPMDKDTLSVEQIESVINGFALNRIKGNDESHSLQIQPGLFRVNNTVSTPSYTIYEVDGMWEVAEEGFGGSFVSKIIIDTSKDEMYLTVVSINAPNPATKRDNIIHALSMEKSFKILNKE